MTRTDRPHSSSSRPPKLEPHENSLRTTVAATPHRNRPEPWSDLASLSRMEVMFGGAVLIEPDEVAERHRVGDFIGLREGIEAERFLEARDKDRDGQRIETGIEQDQVV